MIKNTKIRLPAIGVMLTLMMMLAAFSPACVFASENVPVTIDVSVKYIVKGNADTAGGDDFILRAADPDSPMPEGSEGDTKTINIKDEGSYSFGDMTFTTPGEYWYTVTRDTVKKKGVKKDDSLFRVKIIALNDGHGYLLAYKEKSDDKDDLVYTDQVSPKTGEDNMIIYCGIAFGAAAFILIYTVLRKREEE